jgi:hypothetical protein
MFPATPNSWTRGDLTTYVPMGCKAAKLSWEGGLTLQEITAHVLRLGRLPQRWLRGARLWTGCSARCSAPALPLCSFWLCPRDKAQRTLRVPEHIDSSSQTVMLEHIRIGDGAPPAPVALTSRHEMPRLGLTT